MNILKEIIIFILKIESLLVLKKYKPKIIIITGGMGKTSTKNAVYTVLSQFFFVRKSEKIRDNRIGFPLTILGCPHGGRNPLSWLKNIIKGITLLLHKDDYPEWIILEATARKPGEMKKATSWLYSTVAIFTLFGSPPPHVEFFRSADHLVEEKSGVIKTLQKDGLLILNADDPYFQRLKEETKTKIFSFGFNEEAMITASNEEKLYEDDDSPKGIMFRVNYDGNSVPIIIEGAFGNNHMYAALAALAIAYEQNLNMVEATEALKKYQSPPGRMKLLRGVKDTFIIDDTYNSSPVACISALRNLRSIKNSGRKIAVLGDMLELGKHTDEEHEKIGKVAAESAGILVTVGMRAKMIAKGAITIGMGEKEIFHFEEASKAGKFVEQLIQKGDIVLIKGSQRMRMERAVEEIMAHPENKEKLLVRQTKEWQVG